MSGDFFVRLRDCSRNSSVKNFKVKAASRDRRHAPRRGSGTEGLHNRMAENMRCCPKGNIYSTCGWREAVLMTPWHHGASWPWHRQLVLSSFASVHSGLPRLFTHQADLVPLNSFCCLESGDLFDNVHQVKKGNSVNSVRHPCTKRDGLYSHC